MTQEEATKFVGMTLLTGVMIVIAAIFALYLGFQLLIAFASMPLTGGGLFCFAVMMFHVLKLSEEVKK